MHSGGRFALLFSLTLILHACGGGSGGGSQNWSIANGVATDASGNVYFAGDTDGSLDGNSSSGGYDLFVVKNDAGGNWQWTRLLGSASYDTAQGVAVDGNGNIYAAGYTQYNPENPNSMGDNLLVAKYDSDGNGQWYLILGTNGDTGANGIATDNGGNVYVAGFTYDSIDGNPGAGGMDLFVIKIDGEGNLLWSRQMGTSENEYAAGVSVDNGGNILVAGTTLGSLDGNAGVGGSDLFVIKFDGSGNKLWSRQWGTSASDHAGGVCTDSNENVFVVGDTYGNLDGNTNAGNIDLFVVKYDAGGNRQWSRQLGTPTWDYANAVAADGDGNIYVGGQTYGGLDGNLNAGAWDLVLVKFDSTGNKQWTRLFGGAGDELATGVATDSVGNAYAVGGASSGSGVMRYLIVKYDSAGNKM